MKDATVKRKWKKAINESIVKWEDIAILKRGTKKTQCAMCFLGKKLKSNPKVAPCSACPMFKATGLCLCAGTPWNETSNAMFPSRSTKPGCDADYEMLLTLYMLKVIYPNVEE